MNLTAPELRDLANELREAGWVNIAEGIENGTTTPQTAVKAFRAMGEVELADMVSGYIA